MCRCPAEGLSRLRMARHFWTEACMVDLLRQAACCCFACFPLSPALLVAMPNRSQRTQSPVEKAFEKQYLAVYQAKWAWLAENYDVIEVFGEFGTNFLAWQSGLRSHGDLPIGCAALSLAIACSNGATTEIFGDSITPLCAWFINCNYAQR